MWARPAAKAATCCRLLVKLMVVFWAGSCFAQSDWLDQIGFTSLSQRVDLTDGAGLRLLEVQATFGAGVYMPDPRRATFAGKTFTDLTGGGLISWHANLLGDMVYGIGTSAMPGLAEIDVQESVDYLARSVFYLSPELQPVSLADYDIVTHSWINRSFSTPSYNRAVLKYDKQVSDANLLGLSGVDNIESTSGSWNGFLLPMAIGGTYNSLVMGVSDGWSSPGPTGDGRMKPDLVAPGVVSGWTGTTGKTSWSMGRVATGVGLLLSEARAHGWAGAEDPRVIQAAAMAGAIKLGERYDVVIDYDGTTGTIPAWAKGDPLDASDDEFRPLDYYQGAGQFNVEHSWEILSFGRHGPGGERRAMPSGYDFNQAEAGASNAYYFDVYQEAQSFSAVLDWYAWTGLYGTDWVAEVENLDLVLYRVDADGETLDLPIQASRSVVDNAEHIWIEDLQAGRYALVVEGGDKPEQYGLAWQTLDGMIPGDANNDGWVDQADLTLWQAGYDPLGEQAYHTWLDGDWNADGLVDGTDLALWQSNYAAADGTAPGVPQPSALAILSAGGAWLLRRRK